MTNATKAVRAGRRGISPRIVTITVFLVGALTMPAALLGVRLFGGDSTAAMWVLPASGFLVGLMGPSLRRLAVMLAGTLAGYAGLRVLASELDGDWLLLDLVVAVLFCGMVGVGYIGGMFGYFLRHYDDPP
jgi:hypothetical protein